MTHTTQKLFFILLSICLISTYAFAQSKGELVQLKPISATGEVISVFEGMDNIVLMKISKADTANANFEIISNEVVCTFEFGSKPTNEDPKLPGVKAGDTIKMEFIGTQNRTGDPWNYRVFRYWKITESPSSPKGEKSQK